MDKIEIAIIGGGAISETIYFPLLKDHHLFHLIGVVESSDGRKKYLENKFENINFITIEEIEGKCTAAVVAVPNHLHDDIARLLLKLKIHVLVEKPLSLSSKLAEITVKKSRLYNVSLMVAMVRRFFKQNQILRNVIKDQSFGALKSFEIEDGNVFDWPLASDSLINPEKAGGGILLDLGVHVIDLIQYLLGIPEYVEYYDDSKGGLESECFLKFDYANGVHGTMTLSRIRNLKNRLLLVFDKVTLVVGLTSNGDIQLSVDNHNHVFFLDKDKTNPFEDQLLSFYELIKNNLEPITSCDDAVDSLKFIELCYQNRRELSEVYKSY